MSDKAPALNHKTLGELEVGGIGYAIDMAIAEAMADCARRPTLDSARTVTIVVKFRPKANSLDQGRPGLNNVGVQAAVKLTKPAQSGNEEFLNVHSGVSTTGEPITEATFSQLPLLRPGSN
ncbi:hypothetical protein GO986_16425 [Deinococcus sp. HMF7620]|uniref:Uncharacterized protein n=1 Tax=Deinococcus arboris TaxID=2682977 RepID=A0A7C9HT59_9DEIO|nr:hypothetical protein [Deinococcus arboris]MVN88332.1 hypothetical protein [Deinococcus arboris]